MSRVYRSLTDGSYRHTAVWTEGFADRVDQRDFEEARTHTHTHTYVKMKDVRSYPGGTTVLKELLQV